MQREQPIYEGPGTDKGEGRNARDTHLASTKKFAVRRWCVYRILSGLLLASPGGLFAVPAGLPPSSPIVAGPEAPRHVSWSQHDGGPGPVLALAQTPDGWLWLGTTSGLYRFDGVEF